MQRFGYLIAATLLTGLFWAGVAELVDKLGIQVWLQTSMEASDNSPRTKASNQEQ
jgi:hypothetical protein